MKGESADSFKLNLAKVAATQDPMKFKSKDLKDRTGDVFNDLYGLSKRIDNVRPREAKKTYDIEYEK